MESSRWVVRFLLLLCLVDHLPAVFGANLYACPGDIVTLPCDGGTDKDTSEVKVSWIFGSKTICSFKNGISKCEHPHFVNRAQLGSIRQNKFSLVINPVSVQDHGGYKCLINDAVMQRNRLFVRGGQKGRAAEKLPEESDSLVCKPYEDKEVSDKNPSGAPSSVWLTVSLSVTVVTVGIVGIVVLLVWFIKKMRTEPTPNPGGVQTDYEMVPQAPPPPTSCSETNMK